MHRSIRHSAAVTLLPVTAAASKAAGLSVAATKHGTADHGDGTYSDPLFYGEFEDPDVTRVGEDFYRSGTTKHINPDLRSFKTDAPKRSLLERMGDCHHL